MIDENEVVETGFTHVLIELKASLRTEYDQTEEKDTTLLMTILFGTRSNARGEVCSFIFAVTLMTESAPTSATTFMKTICDLGTVFCVI